MIPSCPQILPDRDLCGLSIGGPLARTGPGLRVCSHTMQERLNLLHKLLCYNMLCSSLPLPYDNRSKPDSIGVNHNRACYPDPSPTRRIERHNELHIPMPDSTKAIIAGPTRLRCLCTGCNYRNPPPHPRSTGGLRQPYVKCRASLAVFPWYRTRSEIKLREGTHIINMDTEN